MVYRKSLPIHRHQGERPKRAARHFPTEFIESHFLKAFLRSTRSSTTSVGLKSSRSRRGFNVRDERGSIHSKPDNCIASELIQGMLEAAQTACLQRFEVSNAWKFTSFRCCHSVSCSCSAIIATSASAQVRSIPVSPPWIATDFS
jgi:hypothetical protein